MKAFVLFLNEGQTGFYEKLSCFIISYARNRVTVTDSHTVV